jgi:hypothetical protein
LFTTLILIQIAREHQYAKCLGRWRRSILPFHAILPLPSRHGTAAWQSHSSRGAVSSIASAVMLTAKGLVVARRLLLYSYGAIVLATESRCAALATPVLAPKTVPQPAFRCLKPHQPLLLAQISTLSLFITPHYTREYTREQRCFLFIGVRSINRVGRYD